MNQHPHPLFLDCQRWQLCVHSCACAFFPYMEHVHLRWCAFWITFELCLSIYMRFMFISYRPKAPTGALLHLPWLLDERLCATPGLLRGQAESCCTSTTRGCNEPNVNSVFPQGKCDGIWEEHLLLVSHRLQRTTRAKRGSSPRRPASTSSTAWMIWRRYALTVLKSRAAPPLPQLGRECIICFGSVTGCAQFCSHFSLPLMRLLKSPTSPVSPIQRIIFQIFWNLFK